MCLSGKLLSLLSYSGILAVCCGTAHKIIELELSILIVCWWTCRFHPAASLSYKWNSTYMATGSVCISVVVTHLFLGRHWLEGELSTPHPHYQRISDKIHCKLSGIVLWTVFSPLNSSTHASPFFSGAVLAFCSVSRPRGLLVQKWLWIWWKC